MRLLVLSTSITFFAVGSAFSAELGQYRAGNTYQSIVSPNADICQSHCTGDAQCRSWNYIKINARAQGVCEFNQNDVAPTPSAISISGSNAAQSYQPGLVSGATNTIRVGTPYASQGRSTQHKAKNQRRVVREPVPQQYRAQKASTRPVTAPTVQQPQSGSLMAQQNRSRNANARPSQVRQIQPHNQKSIARPQQFRHDLGGQTISQNRQHVPQAPANVPPHARSLMQYGQPYSAGVPENRSPGAQARTPSNPNYHQSSRQRDAFAGRSVPPHRIQVPSTTQAVKQTQMARRSAKEPITYGAKTRSTAPQGRSVRPISSQNLSNGLTAQQAQQSLFGKLNDDVSVPNSGSPVPHDPNAPVPTQASRPSTPIQQSNLGGLAGPPQP